MNLPCLLDDKMKPRADLHPIRLTVDRSLQPLSMTEMVLPPEDAPVCVRDFVRLCDGFGDDEIYRVSSISEEPGLRRVVQLEHGMATLADDMLPALTYAENVQTILKRILSYQTRIRWRVGDIEADEGVVISAIGQTQSIYAALTSLLDMLPPEPLLGVRPDEAAVEAASAQAAGGNFVRRAADAQHQHRARHPRREPALHARVPLWLRAGA